VCFGNIYVTGYLWHAVICANIRQLSVAHLVLSVSSGWAPRSTTTKSERMGFISEFRYPTKWYSRLVIAILALSFFALLAATAISGYLVYRIVFPTESHSEIDLQDFPGHPQTLVYNVPGEKGPRNGWFFPGLKSAPTVLLCPAYQSSHGELLTLASALQDHQYNVLLFDFSAQGSNGGRTTLGFREIAELRAAMNAVANRGDVDAGRFGLWGMDLGGYVALAESAGDPRVRALAVESPYDRPDEMVGLLVRRTGLGSLPLITSITKWIFHLVNHQYRKVPPLQANIEKLAGVAQLYLESPDDPVLATSTRELYRVSPPPHELVILSQGNYAGMQDDEKRNYENRIVSFFLVNLPPVVEVSQQH
jgi:hypothetical protein